MVNKDVIVRMGMSLIADRQYNIRKQSHDTGQKNEKLCLFVLKIESYVNKSVLLLKL